MKNVSCTYSRRQASRLNGENQCSLIRSSPTGTYSIVRSKTSTSTCRLKRGVMYFLRELGEDFSLSFCAYTRNECFSYGNALIWHRFRTLSHFLLTIRSSWWRRAVCWERIFKCTLNDLNENRDLLHAVKPMPWTAKGMPSFLILLIPRSSFR